MEQRAVALAKLLESLAQLVRSLDEEKLDALLAGNFRLEVGGEEVCLKPKPRKTSRLSSAIPQLDDLVTKLRESTSEEEGEQLLKGLDKGSLWSIAKQVHARPSRADDTGTLVCKIVRQTIGQRVSREAIRGTSVGSTAVAPVDPEDSGNDVLANEEERREPTT